MYLLLMLKSPISPPSRLQVDGVDLSKATHAEAVQVLSTAGDTVKMFIERVTEGFVKLDTMKSEEKSKTEDTEVRPNIKWIVSF